jgi:DNA mismatch endonuclease (patch repair protein)
MVKKISASFRGLTAASPASSRAKKMNRAQDTAHERTLRKLLWQGGLRYRKNVKALPGKPDIVFTTGRAAIFCDGDFWHGRHWQQLSRKLRTGTNPSYWLHKIEANRQRDRRTDESLRKAGWTALRFWETDILRDPERVAVEIAKIVRDAPK